MWNFPSTHYYSPPVGVFRFLPNSLWLPVVKRQLSRAVHRRALFHLWLHPQHLALDPDNALRGLKSIFRVVKALRDAGQLDNPTMGQLAISLRQRVDTTA